jgi:DNA-binding response OmpR family regulator
MVQSAKILVVDDEAGVRFYLQGTLENEGYQVVAVDSGEAALDIIKSETFHLALLDLKMTGIGGMEVLKALAEDAPDTAIIVLTAHASIETSVEALRWGAHDYLFKPFKSSELLESVRTGLLKQQRATRQKKLLAQLEHNLTRNLEEIRAAVVRQHEAGDSESDVNASGPPARRLLIDKVRHEITLDGHALELSPTEFDFLVCLVNAAPRVLSAQEIVRQVQGYETEPWEARDMVRYHVYRIRQKIEGTTGEREVIQTVRGVGYAINEEFI